MSVTIKPKKVSKPAAKSSAQTQLPLEDDPSVGADVQAKPPGFEASPSKDLVSKPVVATVTTQHKEGDTVENQEEVDVPVLVPKNFATVEVALGVTRNLGNYESVKFNVSLAIPCAPDGGEIEETYTQAKDWVDGKVNAINAEIDAQLGL